MSSTRAAGRTSRVRGRLAGAVMALVGAVGLVIGSTTAAQAMDIVSWSPSGTLVDGEQYSVSLTDLDPSTPYMLALCTFDFGSTPACDLTEYVTFTTGATQTTASIDLTVYQEFTSTHAGSTVDVECRGTSGEQCAFVLVDHSDYSYDSVPVSF